MSQISQKLLARRAQQVANKEDHGRRQDEPKDDHLAPDEAAALKKIQSEARAAGSFLASGGKGGLDPSLVLGIMRRDKWRCKACGELGSHENGGLSVHHKYQHLADPPEKKKGLLANQQGRRNDPSQIAAICARCHDKVHEKDRAQHPGEPDAGHG